MKTDVKIEFCMWKENEEEDSRKTDFRILTNAVLKALFGQNSLNNREI